MTRAINFEINPGIYVVAVSGGVDSMVLLDLLSKKPNLKLIVAHFDHGIRQDSHIDLELVQQSAEKYNFPFVFDKANLGPKASEAKAREVRYKFLNKVKKASNAQAIITAHHQDDLLETVIINLIRGTGRKGISSLKSHDHLLRPLLLTSKSDIKNYAKKNDIKWRDDSTNKDTKILRNYIRINILSKLKKSDRNKLLTIVTNIGSTNEQIDNCLNELLPSNYKKLDRKKFISMPHGASKEILMSWLRQNNIRDFDRKKIEKLTISSKILVPGKKIDVNKNIQIIIGQEDLELISR